jgi:hypothetical protein
MNLTGRPPYVKGQKPKKRSGKDPARLAMVAELPCVICHEFKMPQTSPTQVHHCIHGRNSMGRKSPDSMTIPLCEGHHQGDFDTSKIALHRAPNDWKQAYGLDTDWLSWVEYHLGRKGPPLNLRGECAVDGCQERVLAGGYCSPHYRRAQKYGDPLAGGTPQGAVLQWLKDKADHQGNECLQFPFSDDGGYYSVSLGGGKWSKAHRIMCEFRHGSPAPNMVARHSCHNKSCVNPNHLSWGTPAQNSADSVKAGRMAKGSRVANSKLNENMVVEIREQWKRGKNLDQIAANYPAGRGAIWLAATKKTWKHVK